MLDRRHLLALCGAALPGAAWGQAPETPATPPPQVPAIVPPMAPPAVTPSIPAPGTPTPAATPPRPVPPGAIDKSRTYFVFFDLTIDVPGVRLLRRQLNTLVDAGVSEIDLVVSSPGGLVYQALAAYSLIRALPAKVNTHATALVASAANILFLAGEARSADRNARFFFHASQGPVIGNVTGVQLQNRLAQFAAVNAMEAEVYHDRTRLTDADIARFEQEEVFYTADQAKDLGIVQTVADLHIPGDNKSRMVFLE